MDEQMRRETEEALQAGRRALSSLEKARDQLNSASNWGLFDMLGGGLLATMAKHSKMDSAVQYMEEARANLQSFGRELQDVNTSMEFGLDIGSFLHFADYFFDGFLADYLVQERIRDSREQVEEAIRQVRSVLQELESRLR